LTIEWDEETPITQVKVWSGKKYGTLIIYLLFSICVCIYNKKFY